MKLNVALLVTCGVLGVVASVAAIVELVSSSEPTVGCIESLKAKAADEERKMVLPNQDGGYFLLLQGDKPSVVKFHAFLGPKSAVTLKGLMQENGMLNVAVKVEGQCQTDSGLVYTLVSGHYEVPEPKPDPI